MAKKAKTKKITIVPSGVSFFYEEDEPAGKTQCPGCKKGHVVMVSGGFPSATADSQFRCSRKCGWRSPSGKPVKRKPARTTMIPKLKPVKKRKPDSVELRDAIRAEARERMDALIRERAKFPPTFLTKTVLVKTKSGKKRRKKVWVDNPEFTEEMRQHMHAFAVNVVEIRDRLRAEGMR